MVARRPIDTTRQHAGTLARLLIGLAFTIAATVWHHPATLVVSIALFIGMSLWEHSATPVLAWVRLLPLALILCLPCIVVFSGNGLSFTYQSAGVWKAGAILLRMSVATLAMGWSLSEASELSVLEALHALRLPLLLIAVIGFMLRYVHVLADEVHTMQVARRARMGTRRYGLAVAAGLIAILLSRSAQRSERVHMAMLSRGYGRLDVKPPPWELTAYEWRMLVTACGVIGLFTLTDRCLL